MMSVIKVAILQVLNEVGRITYAKMIIELQKTEIDWHNPANRAAFSDLVSDGLVNTSLTEGWVEKV